MKIPELRHSGIPAYHGCPDANKRRSSRPRCMNQLRCSQDFSAQFSNSADRLKCIIFSAIACCRICQIYATITIIIIRGVDRGGWKGLDPLKICRRVRVCFDPLNVTLFHLKLLLDYCKFHIIKDERLVTKMWKVSTSVSVIVLSTVVSCSVGGQL